MQWGFSVFVRFVSCLTRFSLCFLFFRDDLSAHFAQYGQITSVAVPVDAQGQCKGFGFLEFATPQETANAVEKAEGTIIKGEELALINFGGRIT